MPCLHHHLTILTLLQVGHSQASALLPTFIALYELAMMLCTIGQLRALEEMPPAIKELAADIFCDLVSLTGHIAVHYRQKITALKAGADVVIDFDATFGKSLTDIWNAKQVLHDQIWASKLGRKRFSMSVKSLRDKLETSVEVSVRGTLYDEVSDSMERSEDTCHWIKHPLFEFLNRRDPVQVLTITGGAGTGKTILAEWVQERLSRPLNRKDYTVLDFNFLFDSPAESTALACVKSLLNQLLERSVGDIALYEQLVGAFESFSSHRSTEKLEESLWKTLRGGLQAAERGGVSVVIITDGCDAIQGGDKKALAFHTALRQSVSGISSTRVITFSKPVSHLSEGCEHLVITPSRLHEDIRVHLWQTLSRSSYFNQLDPIGRDQFVDELVTKSKGSFLWAFYASRLFQAPSQDYAALRQSITSDVNKLLAMLVTEARIKENQTVQLLLSFMLVVNRPLTVEEFSELLGVNMSKRVVEKNVLDLLKFVPQVCGDVVVVRGGRLHFRSATVRGFLEQQLGKALLSYKDAHLQLTLRVLLYSRLVVSSQREPSLNDLEDDLADRLLSGNALLLYAVQNWTFHFRQSGVIAADGAVSYPKGFAEIFPDTVTFALLERTCWHRYYPDEEAIGLHEFAYRVRETNFGGKHVTVLQSLLTLALAHQKVQSDLNISSGYLVLAVRLGLTLFTATHSIVIASTALFLSWTESIVIKQRTQIVTYREEMIRVMITICKHKYGTSSDEVIRWYEILAKLFVDLKEEEQATIVYRELYEIIVPRHGEKSPKARQIGNAFGSLDVVLKPADAEKDVAELETLVFETNEDLEVSDKMSISMTLRLAQSYIASGKLHLAERAYISLWRRINLVCRSDSSIKIHIAKIQIALEYVKFLRSVKRSEEASSILICLWAEYEHSKFEEQSILIWIREIGIVSKSFGLLTISASILTKVWRWFISNGKADSEEAQRTTVLVTEVVEEITETTITKKTTKITTTEVTETAVKEIFETHLVRCKKTKVDRAFFSACMAVIGVYIKDNNWVEAERIITSSLEISWKAILSTDLKISLSATNTKETILIARRLALCYHKLGLYEKAESVYLRIYYACLLSTSVDRETLSESIALLITFYEEHHRHEKVIEIYVEVVEKYRKTLGHTHALTIQTLYLLAAQCEILGRQDASKYYQEIVTVLNKNSKHCHHDAIKAALFLTRHYHARKMWIELRSVCSLVWETIVHHHKEVKLEVEIIAEIYQKYIHVLEFHAKVEYSLLYRITVEYKETVTVISGTHSSAALLALIELAKICEKSETHYHESISLYEEIITRTKTIKTTELTITETTIRTVKKRLSKMYVTVITTGKAPAQKQTVERAIEMSWEAYLLLKMEFGVWHETTLLKLKEVVILYQRINTQESHVRITQLLQGSVTEVITSEATTAQLFASAKLIASFYVSVGQEAKGRELLHQLRHLIIFRGGWTSTEITLKLNAHVSRATLSFLIAFELGLSSKTTHVSYTEIMANLAYELLLFDEYSRVVEKETKVEIVMETGAKLRFFWEETGRTELLAILDKKLLQLFRNQYASSFKSIPEEHVRTYYLAIVSQLGRDQRTTKIDFSLVALRSGNNKVKQLLEAGQLRQAHEVGRAEFLFASTLQLFRRRECIPYGYKLAEFLALIDVKVPGNSQDDVKNAMLATSRQIMADVLAASHAANIDFAALRFEDLAGLIRLLGTQANYLELEKLLLMLWNRREELQRSGGWSPNMVLQVGGLLVHAQQLHKKPSEATATAELLYYNVRRGRGRLDPETLAVSRLLASLYLTNGRPSSAMSVHEGVLREISYSWQDMESSRARLAGEAKLQLELFKDAHLRSKGQGKPISEFKELYERLQSGGLKELPTFEKWSERNTTTENGTYRPIGHWKMERDLKQGELWKRTIRERPAERPKVEEVEAGKSHTHWWKVFG
jgi:tetratricopeptide (TPR) repeat protein